MKLEFANTHLCKDIDEKVFAKRFSCKLLCLIFGRLAMHFRYHIEILHLKY